MPAGTLSPTHPCARRSSTPGLPCWCLQTQSRWFGPPILPPSFHSPWPSPISRLQCQGGGIEFTRSAGPFTRTRPQSMRSPFNLQRQPCGHAPGARGDAGRPPCQCTSLFSLSTDPRPSTKKAPHTGHPLSHKISVHSPCDGTKPGRAMPEGCGLRKGRAVKMYKKKRPGPTATDEVGLTGPTQRNRGRNKTCGQVLVVSNGTKWLVASNRYQVF